MWKKTEEKLRRKICWEARKRIRQGLKETGKMDERKRKIVIEKSRKIRTGKINKTRQERNIANDQKEAREVRIKLS